VKQDQAAMVSVHTSIAFISLFVFIDILEIRVYANKFNFQASTPTSFVSTKYRKFQKIQELKDETTPLHKLQMGFFDDLFKDAFSNDENLSSDKVAGQLEYEGDSENDDFLTRASSSQQTEVQKKWLASQQKAKERQQQLQQQQGGVRGVKGAPVNPDILMGTTWVLNLYLAGVPDRDPSNDLYGSRVNISNRDKTLGLGANVPEKPSVSLQLSFEENGVCSVESTEFTSGMPGEYKLSDDNKFIRFSVDCLGFQRVVTTKGTITKVFWSEDEDDVTKTSSTYTIPEGFIFADTSIGYGKPGELVMGSAQKIDGVLRLEQKMGILGASTRLVPCGKFSAKMIFE